MRHIQHGRGGKRSTEEFQGQPSYIRLQGLAMRLSLNRGPMVGIPECPWSRFLFPTIGPLSPLSP